MADLQTINVGNLVNDGTGDDLRTAFQKVNSNFTGLNGELTVTAANTDATGGGIFKEKVGTELRFRTINAGAKITVQEGTDSIIISSTAPDAFTRIDTDSGSMLASTHQQITMEGIKAPGSYSGQQDIEVTTDGSSIRFNTVLPIKEILTVYDFGPISGNFTNVIQLSMSTSNSDFGTFTEESRLVLDCGDLSS